MPGSIGLVIGERCSVNETWTRKTGGYCGIERWTDSAGVGRYRGGTGGVFVRSYHGRQSSTQFCLLLAPVLCMGRGEVS